MKIPTILFILFFAFSAWELQAQDPAINADFTQGCDSLTVNFSFSTSLTPPISAAWDFGDGTTSTAQTAVKKYRKPGIYTVSLTLNSTLTTVKPNYINIGRTPNRDTLGLNFIHRDTTGLYTYVIDVSYNNNHPFPYTYQWYVDGVFASNSNHFMQTFDTTGLYPISLRMTDQMGCTALLKDSILVVSGIQVPNVFTPNDDLINDELKITSNGQDVLSFKVFTRMGLLIYKAEGKTIVWDGRLSSGDKVLPGIYFYIAETIKAASPVKKSGFFYIYR